MRLRVFQHTLREARRLVLHWSLLIAGVTWLSLLAYPLAVWIARISNNVPLKWLTFISMEDGGLTGLDQWVKTVTFGTILPVLLVIFAVTQGSWLLAGEEERGSMSLLMAYPLRRYQLVLQKSLVLNVLMLACSIFAWLAVSLMHWVGILVMKDGEILRAAISLFLLSMSFGGVALALGCLTGKFRFTRNILLLVGLLDFVISRLPLSFPGQPLIDWLSAISHYNQALSGSHYFAHILFLSILCSLGVGLACFIFEQRDLPL